MRGNEVQEWERKLKTVFDEIDHQLEAEYGPKYPLHPSRPKQGSTTNPEADGLFNVGATFSAGYGNRSGPGYVVEIRMSTLERVPQEVREEIKQKVYSRLSTRLPATFPEQDLKLTEENGAIRIYGDLSLDD